MALISVSCNKDGGGIFGGDPEGTVTINLGNTDPSSEIGRGSAGNDLRWSLEFGISRVNNLYARMSTSYYWTSGVKSKAEIVSAGTGSGLKSINTNKIPTSGWNSESVAKEGNLYILRYTISWEKDDRSKEHPESGSVEFYYGVQVVDTRVSTDGGIIGFTVKYCPFTPGKGWNQ